MRRIKNKSETHKTKKYHEVPSEKLQEWSDTIVNLNKKCYDYKAEIDTLIDELSWYKAKASRLEREKNEIDQKLMAQLEVNTAHLAHIKKLERESGQFIHDNNQLLQENRGLRSQIEDLESEVNDRDEWERLKTEQEDM